MSKALLLLQKVWDRMHEEEVAGHFPAALLEEVNQLLNPPPPPKDLLLLARLVCELSGTLEQKVNTYELAEDMQMTCEELENLFTRAGDIVFADAAAQHESED